jgi:hypothetical protein
VCCRYGIYMDMHGTGRTCTCSCRDTWLGHEYDGGLVGFGGTATYARAILQTVAAREAMMAARPPPRRVVCSTGGGVCTSMCPPLNAGGASDGARRARTVPGTRKAAADCCIPAGQRLRHVCVFPTCATFLRLVVVRAVACGREVCSSCAAVFGLWK